MLSPHQLLVFGKCEFIIMGIWPIASLLLCDISLSLHPPVGGKRMALGGNSQGRILYGKQLYPAMGTLTKAGALPIPPLSGHWSPKWVQLPRLGRLPQAKSLLPSLYPLILETSGPIWALEYVVCYVLYDFILRFTQKVLV